MLLIVYVVEMIVQNNNILNMLYNISQTDNVAMVYGNGN